MTKYLISFVLVAGFAVSVCDLAWAHAEDGDAAGVAEGDWPISITIAQVSESVPALLEADGLLPDSPWYFLKEWKRGFVKFFKFNALAKAEYELEVADEKAMELATIERNKSNDAEAITKALDNYVEAKELLEARFTSLTKVLNDKNREKAEEILDKWDQKFDEHKALFEDLAERHRDIPAVKEVEDKLDWATPLIKFRRNLDDLAEALRRIQDTEEFKEAVEEIEDIKKDIKKGSEKEARTNCAAIEKDLADLKQKLVAGRIAGPDFAREFGILNNELKECKKK
jgi:hypothetical protein